MTKMIPLSSGKFAKIDDVDYEKISQHKWSYSGEYAQRRTSTRFGMKSVTVLMHREIAETPDGMQTDHINGDGLDNRRENLRICTRFQNQQNQKTQSNSKSGFKGVTWYERRRKWRAQIHVNNRVIYLGCFVSTEKAARIYDKAAKKYFGEFAKLNFND